MKAWDSVGLIINPKAGRGFPESAHAAVSVLAALRPRQILTGPGQLGAEALSKAEFPNVTVLPVTAAEGRAQTQELASAIATKSISTLVVIGGDGTLADAACVLINTPNFPPLLGIGVGSTNAGTLVTCRAKDLSRFDPTHLKVISLRALMAQSGGRTVGLGFNDCVLGFTVVGTLDGVLLDLDAAARFSGKTVAGQVQSVGTRQTRVERIGPDGVVEIASGLRVATVVVGLAEREFFAKAITGGICLASLVKAPAGCLVADQPLVRIKIQPGQVLSLPPITSTYLTFAEHHRIRVRGVRTGTALCVDGNPVQLLGPADLVEFGVTAEVVQSLQLQ